MSKLILIDGDQVTFLPAFGQATVMVQPGKITASGPATLGGKKLCVEGDETSVEVAGCTYVMPPLYTIPGTGTLKIKKLGGDQVASKTRSGGAPVLLQGGQFEAVFEVESGAQQPPTGGPPPPPDKTPSYDGLGFFTPANSKFSGS
jgi:hypothetical protein